MTKIKQMNGFVETTHGVETDNGVKFVYKRLRTTTTTTTTTTVVVEEVVEEVIEEVVPVAQEYTGVQIPPASWKGVYVPQPVSNVVHVDFGYEPPKKKVSKKKPVTVKTIMRRLFK